VGEDGDVCLDLCVDDIGACDCFRVAEAQVLKRAASRKWEREIEYTRTV